MVATSGVGVAIRAGAPKIDATTSEGHQEGAAQRQIDRLFDRAERRPHRPPDRRSGASTEQVRGKIVPPRTGTPIGEVVARGDAEIGFQQVSELLPVKGIDYLGPLPADINEITVFAAAVHKAGGRA